MKEIFLFRHGETDWNSQKRFQGHTDIPLNKIGRMQAERLKIVTKDLGIEVVLSSDLSRAHETALIAFENTPIYLFSELRETSIGEVEGMLKNEVIEKFGQQIWKKWRSISSNDLDFSFPGGETKQEHLDRLVSFLEGQFQSRSERKIGISAHGGVLRRLVHFSVGSPLEPVPIPNCQIYKLTYKNRIWKYIGGV